MNKPLNVRSFSSFALMLIVTLLAACAPAAANPTSGASTTSSTTASSTVSNTTTVSDTSASTSGEVAELRIGYQRGGEYWNLLKAEGTLEKLFGPNVKITWSLFAAGPPMLEALNAGAIDIGEVGETPPIFAQAAGAPLLYVAQEASSGAGSAILVPDGSPIKSLADLKGKKVAFTKASSAHLLLIRALEKNGLKYSDIEPALLAPPDARAAFEGGSVDAWVIWNPFFEAAVQELKAQILIDGADVSPTRSYVIAAKPFVEKNPNKVLAIIDELKKSQVWAKDHVDEYAALLEKETQLSAAVWKGAFNRERPELQLLDDQTAVDQQKVADIFFDLQLIPEKLDIKSVIWEGNKAK
ncbi:MAG: aliphatic sulfonate ABC transporter substrate-binding protein [Chloroflexi bacterium]|nr:aliphatic sulfonate ABC transporter substrate-binding protein [Chloroflexota bacterium]